MIAFNHAYVNNFMWTGIDQSGSPVRKSATQPQPSQQLQIDYLLRREIFGFHTPRNMRRTKVDPTIVSFDGQRPDPSYDTCYFFEMALLGIYT